MNASSQSRIISIGLAIFSMFFGAGNLIYPIIVGISSGNNTFYGMVGFLLTAILLPLMGLIAMILFDGNYVAFFERLGKSTGELFIFTCMVIIGPLIAIPRIVTLSHTMIAPFLPLDILQHETLLSSFIFSLLFLGITYAASYRENRIVDLLGWVISPTLLICLMVIIIKGLITTHDPVSAGVSPWIAFKLNFIRGYETLDLLGAIFFSSIVMHILKNTAGHKENRNSLALVGLKAGLLGVSLLGLVYIGMGILGMYHGHDMGGNHAGQLFRIIAHNVIGANGAFIIGLAVLMACLSTSIALAAVVGDYIHVYLRHKLSYEVALALLMFLCLPLSTFGLGYVLKLTGGPLTYIGYPVLIALTACNIAYKLFGFKPVRIPVIATFLVSIVTYFS